MDLAAHQRILLGLVRSSYQVRPDDDPYFHDVAKSRDLEEARGNIFLWRVYVLERTCVLTMALLRQRHLLAPSLQAFIQQENISPFREFQPPAFLEFLADHSEHLVASVSQFELALMKVRGGDTACHTVQWNVEPSGVLKAVAEDSPLDALPRVGAHVTRLSRDLPFLFKIESAEEIDTDCNHHPP